MHTNNNRQLFFSPGRLESSTRRVWTNFKRPHVLSKLAILGLVSAVMGCYVAVYPWVFQLGSPQQMVLTHVSCGAMLAITGVTSLGFVFGRDTPRYLTMAQAVLGAALLLAVSGVCFAAWGRRSEAKSHQVIPGYHTDGTLNSGALLAAAILALLSGFAYLADIGAVILLAR